MTAAVAVPFHIPSLGKALGTPDFTESRKLYNGLRDDSEQPNIDDEHIQKLAALFVRHGAQEKLGIHLIHGHFSIPESTVLLGKNFDQPKGRWAKITSAQEIDTSQIHGHIFVVQEDGLCAYEYQEGPLPDMSEVGAGFLEEFITYVRNNRLTELIGLQVLDQCNDRSMSELILDDGTVMLDTSVLKNCFTYRTTGWRFTNEHGNPRVCAANETHSGMTSGNHKVFNAGKPHPKLENVDDLKAALVDVGIL